MLCVDHAQALRGECDIPTQAIFEWVNAHMDVLTPITLVMCFIVLIALYRERKTPLPPHQPELVLGPGTIVTFREPDDKETMGRVKTVRYSGVDVILLTSSHYPDLEPGADIYHNLPFCRIKSISWPDNEESMGDKD